MGMTMTEKILARASGRDHVSPGDLVETCLPENHRLAKSSLEAYLGHIPFYSGIGNHEYHNPEGCVADQIISSYTSIWDRPVRYTWIEQGITCIMLDYPDPTTLAQETEVYISQQTLNYLSSVLTCYPDQIACIFLHCPLQNTVLDRDPAQHRDYNSLQHFFAPENSQASRVRMRPGWRLDAATRAWVFLPVEIGQHLPRAGAPEFHRERDETRSPEESPAWLQSGARQQSHSHATL